MYLNNPLVLVVDPDPIHQELLEGILEAGMTVILSSTAIECLELFDYKHPDIVILEIDLPDMDGYMLCQQLKKRSGETGCAVVFLAEAMSLEDKIEGYQHGCDEFITKPFQPEELVTKTRKILELKAIQRKILKQSADATQTALTAMRQSSEMGMMLRFMAESTKCTDYERLGQQFIAFLRGFSLTGCLLFKTIEKDMFVGCQEDSEDALLLGMYFGNKRFVSDGPKLLVNHGVVEILVNDMPHLDNQRYGELKDVIGIVINSISARAESINIEQELTKERSSGLDSSIQICHERMKKINDHLAKYADDVSHIMDNLLSDIRGLSLSLGLSEDQEVALFEKLDGTMDNMERSYSDVTKIEADFTVITRELTNLLLK